MKRNFILTLILVMSIFAMHAQDSLDSIARVHITVQVDELTVEQFANFITGEYVWCPKLQKMADEGNPAALHAVGCCYRSGSGCKKDEFEAFEYFSLAAEAGNHKALNNLGNCYEHGIGIEKDLHQAYLFYKKAALKGHEVAMSNLGQCYMRGMGTEVDYQKARAWFEKTANSRGDRVAIVNTGFLYFQIGDDYAKAFKYLTKGAEMGSPGATEWLAMCYGYGLGCEQDLPKAIGLLNKVLNMSERIKIPGEYDFIREKITEFEQAIK